MQRCHLPARAPAPGPFTGRHSLRPRPNGLRVNFRPNTDASPATRPQERPGAEPLLISTLSRDSATFTQQTLDLSHQGLIAGPCSSWPAAPHSPWPRQQFTEQRVEEVLPAPTEPNPLTRLWNAYSVALEERPILVKSLTSLVGFFLGDMVAQTIVGNPYDLLRTLRLVLFGVFMDGPVGHYWYTFLDKVVYPEAPKSNKAVVLKMAMDQFLWAPVFSCVFFTFINVLSGQPQAVLPSIQAKLLPMMLANYMLWPLAHIINFKYIPSSQRILYINCVQVLWSAYLSNLSSMRMRLHH